MEKITLLDDAIVNRFPHPIPKWMYGVEVFCITHYYSFGDEKFFLWRKSGNISAVRAAVYCQFFAEKVFREDACVSNLGIAAALVTFYGFGEFPRIDVNYEKCTVIEMYEERDRLCGDPYHTLMEDVSLHREGLKQFLEPFVC